MALRLGLLLWAAAAVARGGRAAPEEYYVDRTTVAYCNLPNTNSIPPLHDDVVERHPGLELLQVQAVARHGSRTPHVKYVCWNGYGFKWDCNVTAMALPAPDNRGDVRQASWLFRKIYDGSPTVLGGTCHLGQLVEDGYKQESDNGVMLRKAYIGPGPLRLFASSHLGEIPAHNLYLRSDDDPSYRTEMSGEFLLRGLFTESDEINLPWHTGDFELDNIYPNFQVCPALRRIEELAYASPEWQAYNTSTWARRLSADMEKAVPGFQWANMLDCLMTTACTGRPFPGSMDKDLFDKAALFSAEYEAFPFHWNNSYFSRLAMAPLARELIGNLKLATTAPEKPLKFALFLGHDTTVLPLLAAWGVWDRQWPSYASLLALELYTSDSGHLFRMVYAGRELLLPNCPEPLCPVSALIEATEPWAVHEDERPCDLSLYPGPSPASASPSFVHSTTPGAGGISVAAGAVSVVMVMSMVLGLLLGTVATIAWSRRGLDEGCGSYGRTAVPLHELESI